MADTASAILAAVNSDFWSVFHGRSFMTACCVVLDADGTLSHAGAGHPPVLIRRKSGAVEALPSHGTMLGISQTMAIAETATRLASEDLALIYTDGLYGLRAPDRTRFGHHAVADALRDLPLASDPLLPGLISALEASADGSSFEDDVAAFAIRRIG